MTTVYIFLSPCAPDDPLMRANSNVTAGVRDPELVSFEHLVLLHDGLGSLAIISHRWFVPQMSASKINVHRTIPNAGTTPGS